MHSILIQCLNAGRSCRASKLTLGAQTPEIFFPGIPLNEACLLFLIMFCGDSLGFAVARGETGEGGGRVTADCSVSMASLSFISELSNTVLYAFLYCVQRPGATKYTLYGSCLVTYQVISY